MSQDTCNRCGRGVAEFMGYEYNDKGKVLYCYKCTVCNTIHKREVDPKWDMEHPKAKFGFLPTKDWMKRKGLII